MRMWLGSADTASQGLGLDRSKINFRGAFVDWLSLCIGGLHQFIRGESSGRLLLGAWILLGLATLVLIPSTFGSVCLGLFFSVHLISIVDVFFRQQEEWETRLRFVGLTLLLLGVFYFSIIRCVGQFVTPIQHFARTSELESGDILWYFDNNETKPGDLVAYDLGRVELSYRLSGEPIVFRASGMRISRQVAGSGQVVSWKNGKLFVDGIECSWQPGNFMAQVADFELIVAENSIFVTPEGILNGDLIARMDQVNSPVSARAGGFDIGRFGEIPKSNVRGRVFLRSFPWTSIRWY